MLRTLNLLVALLLFCTKVHAAIIDETQSVRADFEIVIEDPFSLPANRLDYTVEFYRTNPLKPGEGYRVTSYNSSGVELGVDSYFNTDAVNIIGCACIGIRLDPLLETIDYYAIIDSLSGSFDVSGVFSLASTGNNGNANSILSVGTLNIVPKTVPEPATLSLMGLGLAGLGFRNSKQTK